MEDAERRREVRRIVNKYTQVVEMPRDVHIALTVLLQMVKYAGSLENREKAIAEVRAKAEAEYDRRYPARRGQGVNLTAPGEGL